MEISRFLPVLPVLFVFFVPGSTLSGYFWHVTDFHLDVNYSTDGNPTAMCWWKGVPSKVRPMGKWGDYKCDSPYSLVLSAVGAMKQIGPEADFILWTGDDKAHVSDSYYDNQKVFYLIANLTNTLTNAFPDVPLVPVLGNHDWFPTHLMPPDHAPLYDDVADLWSQWIGDGTKTFKAGGYYTTLLPNGFRIVILNTVLYYTKNKVISGNAADPGGQFTWFENILKEARSEGKKIYVTAHVPPGVFERHFEKGGWQWFHQRFNKKYVKLMSEYGDVIAAQFFAHQHTDGFRIFYDSQGKPSTFILSAPSVTPWNTTLSEVGPNNPGIRKIYYDVATGQVTNFDQFYLNLTAADMDTNQLPTWEHEYSATSAYGIPSISASTLDSVAQTFTTSNRTLFDKYYLYNSVSYQDPEECDTYCQIYHFCAITNVDFNQFEKCRKNGAGNSAKMAGKWWGTLTVVVFTFSTHFFYLR